MSDQSLPHAPGWARKAGAFITELPGRVVLAIDGWRERHRLRRELGDLAERGELDRTLADSGIAPSDVPRLLQAHPHTPEQFALMLRRLGIDRTALSGNTAALNALRAMEWRCGECDDWRRCRHWLASSHAPDTPENYRAFCPNAEALDKLRCAVGAVNCGSDERHGVLDELKGGDGE